MNITSSFFSQRIEPISFDSQFRLRFQLLGHRRLIIQLIIWVQQSSLVFIVIFPLRKQRQWKPKQRLGLSYPCCATL